MKLLSAGEQKRYRREALPWMTRPGNPTHMEPKGFDPEAAKRWVAKRAYSHGWTKSLFPYDDTYQYDASSQRPQVERIGKKYQWLALSELVCRLADNYWLSDKLGFGTRRYDSPVDIGFLRDIDPTVLTLDTAVSPITDSTVWTIIPELAAPDGDNDKLLQWPFLADPGSFFRHLIHHNDQEGRQWITLHLHQSVTTRHSVHWLLENSLRQQEFRIVYCVIVEQSSVQNLVAALCAEQRIDALDWEPPEVIDGGYLSEAYWRSTWPQAQWDNDRWPPYPSSKIAFPVCRYSWESHLDASLPEGARFLVPSPWLLHQLALLPDRTNPATYCDVNGKCQFMGSVIEPKGSSAVIDADTLSQLSC